MAKRILFFVLFTLWANLFILAQESIVKGFIYDNSSGEPLPYATLHLEGTSYGAMSDRNGAFIINKIPNGKYILQITLFGFNSVTDTITLIRETTLVKRYTMAPSSVSLEAVQVSAEAQRNIQETRIAVTSVTPKEIMKMPSIGGQPDFAQYLQVLPGIISTGDQGGQIYVRGGTPIQNMLLLDGMLVLNPFHSMGLFSVFDTDIISTADVYTGGFGAEFAGRVSSVMNIQTRDGNKKRISGKVDINTFGAKVLLEGPLVKLKDQRKSALSYILSAKGSYLKESSKIFYPYVTSMPYNYLDLYGKLSFTSIGGSKVSLFGFRFDDRVHYNELTDYNWKNWGIGSKFLIVPGAVPTTIEGAISYSNYITRLDEKVEGFDSRESSMDVYSANLTFNYYIGKSVLNAGFDLLGYTTRYTLGSNSFTDYATDIGIFVKYKYNFRDKLLIEPSFRLQSFISQSATSPEPRLALKYNITRNVRIKFAGGLYSQNYVAISSDRDVVNIFSGYLSSVLPGNLPSSFYGKEYNNGIQKAQHLILGLELDVIKHVSFNVEGYFKNFSILTSANRYKLFEDNSYYAAYDEIYRKEYMWEKGYAVGGDITAKVEYKGLYLWCVYSLGWVKRTDALVEYFPHFDRRHNINILVSYAFGKRSSWQVDVRWNYGSGFPFTRTKAVYPHESFPGGIGDDYIYTNEDLEFILSDINEGRLPSYHRMDLSVKKKFFLGERQTLDLTLSATNLYNYSNIFYVNRATNEVIYQLPILYNVGISWNF